MKQQATMNVLPATQNQFTANATAYGFSFAKKQTTNMKKGLLLLMVLFSSIALLNAQNAIVGAGFSTGWGNCNTDATNYTNFSASAGTSYSSGALTPNGTGNQYWRLAKNWSSQFGQYNNGSGSDALVAPGTTYTLNTSSCASSGALYYNVPSTSYRYIFKTKDASTSPSGVWVFFEVQGTPVTVSTVTKQNPAQDVATLVTATLSGALPVGQAVYLRCTNNAYSTSQVIQMTGSGTSYTASIPNTINTSAAAVSFYVFTSGTSGVASDGSNADLYSINFNNNAGSNYTYTVPTTYYSKATGAAQTLANWTTNRAGTGTVASNFTTSGQVFVVQPTHNMTVGSSMSVSAGVIFEVESTGILTQSSALTMNGTMIVLNGGKYVHANSSAGTVPTATWNTGSTCEIQVGGSSAPGGLGQAFYNLTWNSSSQSGAMGLGAAITGPINGDFTITNTNGSNIRLASSQTLPITIGGKLVINGGTMYLVSSTGSVTLNVAGDCNVSSGTLGMAVANSSGTQTINIGGNLNLSGGTIDYTTNSTITAAINLSGNFNITGGTITESGTATTGMSFNFSKTGTQTFSQSVGTIGAKNINFTVNSGSILDMSTQILGTSTGTFTLSSGAGIKTASVDATGALTTAATGAHGSIQVTGTRTFDPGADYTFNGGGAQVTGNGFTGARNLTISNASGVTETSAASVSGILNLSSGVLNTKTNSAPITVTSTLSTAVSGSSGGYVDGKLIWNLPSIGSGDYIFPLGAGATYLPFDINAPTGTSPVVTVQAFAADVNASGTGTGAISSISHTEYWLASNTGTFTNGTVSLAKASIGTLTLIGSSTSTSSFAPLGTCTASNIPITSNSIKAGSTSGSLATPTYFVLANGLSAPTIASSGGVSASVNDGVHNYDGYVGSTVTITGTNFTSGMTVKIGSVGGVGGTDLSSSYTLVSSTSITFVAPNVTGTIYVQNSVSNTTSSETYTTMGYISNAATDWNTTSTWLGNAVPPANAIVTINHAVTLIGTVSNAPNSVTVKTGKSLTFGASGTISINDTLTIAGTVDMSAGGTLTIVASTTPFFTNNGTFTTGGTVVFSNATTINGSAATTFNNLTLTTGTLTLSTVPSINGIFTINGGSVSAAPKYGASSTLYYNIGYGRYNEWNASGVGTIGTTAGYPNNVTINTGTYDLYNSASGIARALAGVLTINNGATVNFNGMNAAFTVGKKMVVNTGGTVNFNTMSGSVTVNDSLTVWGTLNMNSMSTGLTISKDVNINGTIGLSSTSGGDLNIGGNYKVAPAASINYNGRAVNFNGTGNQVISLVGGGTLSFAGTGTAAYFLINNTGGSVQLSNSPATSVSITQTTGNVLQILSSGSLDLNGQTFTLNGGNIYVNGASRTITSVSGAASFVIAGTVAVANNSGTGALVFGNNVTVNLNASGNIDFGYSSGNITTLNGTLSINSTSGCFVNNNPPIYGSGSTLQYNTGASYGASNEWTSNATSGAAGVPNNVTLVSGSSLNFGSSTSYRLCTGTVTINSSSTLALSTAAGGDLKLSGDFVQNGTFTPNSRAIFFIATSGTQNIKASAGTVTIPYIFYGTSSGTHTVYLYNTNILATADNGGGTAISFNSSTDVLDLHGYNITFGTISPTPLSCNFSGGGTIKGNASSTVTIQGSTSTGTLGFTSGSQTLNGLTVNMTGGFTLASPVSVSSLTLTAGTITLGSNDLTVTGSISGASSSNYIVTNSSGSLIQTVPTSNTNIVYPVGPSTSRYNPITLNNYNATSSSTFNVLVAAGTDSHIQNPATYYVQDIWTIKGGSATGNQLIITPQWSTASTSDEGSTYDRTTNNLIGLYSTGWASQSATYGGSGPIYTATNGAAFTGDLSGGVNCMVGNFPATVSFAPAGSGLASSPLIANAQTQAILGFTTSINSGTSTLTQLGLTATTGDFSSYSALHFVKFSGGTPGVYGSGTRSVISTVTSPSGTTATFSSFTAESITTSTAYYFIEGDVAGSAGGTTGVTTQILSSNVTVTGGSLKSGTVTGSDYAFNAYGSLHHFNISTISSPQVSGVTFTPIITAQDVLNNTVTSFNGGSYLVAMTSTAGTVSPASSPAFVNGVMSTQAFLVPTANTARTITATYSTITGTSNTFDVTAGTLASFVVEATSGGTITPQTAGSSFNYKITAKDANNNTLSSGANTFTGTVDITCNGTTTTGLGTTASFSAGVLSSNAITITQSGSRTITATLTGGGAAGTSTSFTVNPVTASQLAISNISNQTYGTAFGVIVIAEDTYGNASNATSDIGLTLSTSGSGSLGTTSATITNGTSSKTISAETYSQAENGITITASQISGTPSGLTAGTSNSFNVAAIVPTVTTNSTSSLTTTSVVLHGTVNANTASTTTGFDYGTSTSYGSSATADQSPLTSGTATGTTATVSSLTANTVYHFRANATNSAGGPINGSDASFTTLSLDPSIVSGDNTAAQSSATASSFTAQWTAPATQGAAAFTYSLDYTTDISFATGITTINSISSAATTQLISGLTQTTTYYYRVKVVNAGGSSNYATVGTGILTLTTPVVALAGISAVSAGGIVKGTTNNVINNFSLAVTAATTTLNQVTIPFTKTGLVDLDITNFKLYYTTTSTFNTGTLLSTVTATPSTSPITFGSLTQTISSGTSGYFWVTIDVASGATIGHIITPSALATSNLTFNSTVSSSGTVSAQGAQTISAPTYYSDPTATTLTLSSNTTGWSTSPGGSPSGVYSLAMSTNGVDNIVVQSGSVVTFDQNFTTTTATITVAGTLNISNSYKLITAANLTVSSGGILNINASGLSSGSPASYGGANNGTLEITAGTFNVSGTVNAYGYFRNSDATAITYGGSQTFAFSNFSFCELNNAGITAAPTATWTSNSNLLVTAIAGTGNLLAINTHYGNFNFNYSAAGTGHILTSAASGTLYIDGNFTLTNSFLLR